MSDGRLSVDFLGDEFLDEATSNKDIWVTTLLDPEGDARPVRVIRRRRTRSAKQRLAHKARSKALDGLKHPAIGAYHGDVECGRDVFDVFDAPELLSEDHLSLRLTPAALTDRLLDILPAIEEFHEAGLVHGALSRSTIRTRQSGQTIILGMEEARLSDERAIDLDALANYCAAALGAVPGIPVEVFLKTGNRRINRRLCSAIQGVMGEEGYEPVTSIRVFHDLIVGKAKPSPVRKPPILTQNEEYAPSEEMELEPDGSRPYSSDMVSTGIGLVAACTLAIIAVPLGSNTNVNSGLTAAEEAAQRELIAENVRADIEEIEDAAHLQPRLELDEDYFSNTWLGELVPATLSDPSDMIATELAPYPIDLTLFKTQTAAWIEAEPQAVAAVLAAPPAPINAEPIAQIEPVVLDLSLFKAQTSAWIATKTEPAVLAPVEEVAVPVLEVSTEAVLDLSLFKAQTTAWLAAKTDIDVAVPVEPETRIEEVVETVEISAVTEPGPVPALPAPRKYIAQEITDVQLFEDTPTDIRFERAFPKPRVRTSGRVLSSSELKAIVGGEVEAPTSPAPAEVKLSSERPTNITDLVISGTPNSALESVRADAILAKSISAVEPDIGRPFRDCGDCPEMLRLPTILGSKGDIAMAVSETTVSQYRAFITDTRANLSVLGGIQNRNAFDPGFEQTDHHPVTYVSLDDAKSFAEWISEKTGQTYRLPTLAEWEYAAKSSHKFSARTSHQCEMVNGADAALSAELPKKLAASCSDAYTATAPARSFPANQLGLYDMLGNVAEWVSSTDGTDLNISKGGSWLSYGTDLSHEPVSIERRGARLGEVGFRLVREID